MSDSSGSDQEPKNQRENPQDHAPKVVIRPARRRLSLPVAQVLPVIIVMLVGSLFLHWDFVQTWIQPLLSMRTVNTAKTKPARTFGGVGLALKSAAGGAEVVRAFPNTPAALAGLQPGDLITAIDGISLAQKTLPDISARLRGPEGSGVTISYSRGGGAPREVTLMRVMLMAK